ncbi:hypothetical protein Gohar_028022, partial [Gossypium harknessii]|nr:hypothetical protein [Gossypium harknessii]
MSRQYNCCIDWLEDMMRAFDKRAMADLMSMASNLSKYFHIYNILNEHLLSQNEAIKKWEKPPKGVVKINFDASINVNRMGYGVIIRDDDGFVLGGGGGFINKRVSVHDADCITFERSIKLACQLNVIGDMLFETDHAGLVNKMHNNGMDVTIINARIKEC